MNHDQPKLTARGASTRMMILRCSADLVGIHGLTNWSIERVAGRAEVAKGLVLYHFKTKKSFLEQTARFVAGLRASTLTHALSGSGTVALDACWHHLVESADNGLLAAQLALLAGPETRGAAAWTPEEERSLRLRAAQALGIGRGVDLTALPSFLNGCGLALLQGEAAERVRERYDRFWLALL